MNLSSCGKWKFYVNFFFDQKSNTNIVLSNINNHLNYFSMKTRPLKVKLDQLSIHPYHLEVYGQNPFIFLTESIRRTGKKPVYPIVVVPTPNQKGKYKVISGVARLDSQISLGAEEMEVIVCEIIDEPQIRKLIVDLNKQRIKSGMVLYMEFLHYLGIYPQQRGVKGSRYDNIGNEMGMSSEKVKDLVMMNNFFHGDGEVIMVSLFGGDLTLNQAATLKKVVEEFPDKFNSAESYRKLCSRSFDFNRLRYAVMNLSIDVEEEFKLIKSYLCKDLTIPEFTKMLVQMGKVEKRVDDHEKNKVAVPEIDDVFTTEHVRLLKGDNREVIFSNPFGKLINCLLGSPPYGDRRLNSEDTETETGHHMDGQEYAIYLAETYERYFQYMAPDGSIYVIIDDYRMNNGAHACSLEHFVIEMSKRGAYLVGRYTWMKSNPMPRSYADSDMVNSFEMCYRFSLDPKNYYCNPNLFIELDKRENGGFQEGCTNTTNDGKTSRGSSYYQSHLKKLRNSLDENTCMDIIRGNVANPEDFFRQADQKRHTSTSPIYLTSILILESTRPGDLCVDIWNGVGNSMVSAILLGCEYIGVEKEGNYFQQSISRVIQTEEMLGEVFEVESSNDYQTAA